MKKPFDLLLTQIDFEDKWCGLPKKKKSGIFKNLGETYTTSTSPLVLSLRSAS